MSDAAEVVKTLDAYLRLQTMPVGVKMLRVGEDIPPKAKVPVRDFGCKLAICQVTSMARRIGWTVALTGEDESCPIGLIALGFAEAVDYYTQGNLCEGMYTETLEAGARSEAAVKRFERGQYSALVIGPLARLDLEPDFVLVYGNPAQMMRLVHAALYKEGGAISSSFTGRGECSEIIVNTILSGQPQLILPGNGERVFGQTNDDEMAFTIPWSKVDAVMEGLAATHKAGVRYPIPSWLMYQAVYPPKYQKLQSMLGGVE